nr:MAG TPA: SITE SPECIFIC RECOMBINASE XERD [Bacteriophage sp.]
MESIEEYMVAIRKIDEYSEYLAKRGRKTNSIETMRYMLTGSIRRMSDKDQHTDPTKIGRDEVLTMLDCNLSPTTKKTYVAVLRSWLKYNGNSVIEDMGLLWSDNAKANVKWINEAEFKVALTMTKNPTEEMIMLLGARCGLRRHEMVVLKTTDIRDGMMTVHGKGHGADGKIRIIPLSEKMLKKISEYNLYREECKFGKRVTPGDYLLFRMTKNKITPFADNKINFVIKGISERSKIDFTPHSLRRLFATTAASCTDLHVVQTLMGHTNISTTERYVKRERSALMSAMEMISAKI